MALGGKIRSATRQAVRQRAAELCEYCHTSERWQYVPFTIDHVIPLPKAEQTVWKTSLFPAFIATVRREAEQRQWTLLPRKRCSFTTLETTIGRLISFGRAMGFGLSAQLQSDG
jgi:5-methylcytosine-specific restriction endonuclease McrA